MGGTGSGAAAARDRGGPPPRLVAVPGGGDGRPVPRPARTVVFLGVADDARSLVAAALLAHRSKGRVRAVSASPAAVDPDPAVAASLTGGQGRTCELDGDPQQCLPHNQSIAITPK